MSWVYTLVLIALAAAILAWTSYLVYRLFTTEACLQGQSSGTETSSPDRSVAAEGP